jgi:hypothetical protein
MEGEVVQQDSTCYFSSQYPDNWECVGNALNRNGMIMVRPATVGEMEAYLKLKKIVDHEDWSPVRGGKIILSRGNVRFFILL